MIEVITALMLIGTFMWIWSKLPQKFDEWEEKNKKLV